ncbi:MAG: hypothetical protein ABJ092_14885 [Gillisia sp.]
MTLQEIHQRIEELLEIIKKNNLENIDIKAEETELAYLENMRENLEQAL